MKQIKLFIIAVYLALPFLAGAESTELTVYKSPTCGCCQKWVDYLAGNGINSKVVSMNDLTTIKSKNNISGQYRSCHTAISDTEKGKYIFEGHIPSKYIKQFLQNPPEGAIGLSVPGMPIGSPGMELGERKDYYQVLQLNANGDSSVYAHVNCNPSIDHHC